MNLSDAKINMQKAIDFFSDELRKIRAGRATPDLVKDIKVSAYSTMMPLEQLANINVADATLLTVQPWDKGVMPEIMKALQTSSIGISPTQDGDIIRLPIPPLTGERREEYVKVLRQKSEEAKITIRQKRKDHLLDLEKAELPEDDKKRKEKELQDLVEEMNSKIDEITKKKEEELMTV